jgi:hypothetical protein
MVGIVDVADQNVTHVVVIAVKSPVGSDDAGFYDVAQNVNTFELGERNSVSVLLKTAC